MAKINYLNKNRSLKFIQLYYKLGFIESGDGLFEKKYQNDYKINIDFNNDTINFNGGITVINGEFKLNTQKNFVILILINELLLKGFSPLEIIIDLDNSYDVYLRDIYFKCYEYGTMEDIDINYSNKFLSVYYEARLLSGLLENHYIVSKNGEIKDSNETKYEVKHNKDFEYNGTTLIKYKGNSNVVKIPEGTEKLSVGVFWDNQNVTEVIFNEGIKNIGGDTFYNCKKLKKVNIPSTCEAMGDNPFAGCENIEIINNSKHFIFENDALYNKEKSELIFFKINSKQKYFEIPSTVYTISKHAFYMTNLEKIVIPKNVKRLVNNPFSAGRKLKIENHSPNYIIENDVIYTKDYKKVIGALNSIKAKKLILRDVETIQRNSFYNCSGLEEVVLPKTLNEIEYNPFIGCKNISFTSFSDKYKVKDGILYNEDYSKLICAPSKYVGKNYKVIDSVITLERGAFSGNELLETINLKNVNVINKSCFTNCNSLREIYFSDLVSYIGERAFAHCKNLKEVTYGERTECDPKAFLNSNVNIKKRSSNKNYLINSDNIYTLKSMLGNYENKIDCICIDPPYNSEIDYIGYKDSNFTGGYKEFMKSRLVLAYRLLSEKGTLIINIDKGEVDNLFKLSKEIFSQGQVTLHKWKKIHDFFDTNRIILNKNKPQTLYEYIIICRKNKKTKLKKIMQPFLINNEIHEELRSVPKVFDCFGTTSSAKDEISMVFGERTAFSTPKPIKLIEEFIRATTDKNSIVLDFFAGSGTTGVATNALNKDDGGNRKFILITNDESNICESITKRRLEFENISFDFLK